MSVKRRLTCILAADAVTCSKQMGQDEEGTMRVLFVAAQAKYVPEPGYVGEDEFEYEALARAGTNRQLRLKVHVKASIVAPWSAHERGCQSLNGNR